ncbi:MAG: MBL fold metallo-hydrolase [Cyclobacteriaceae bacterium]|nr:MBL fold metallo-hydrolase [Cyclobacteriaceae bacterium]
MATRINIKMYKVKELGDCFLLTVHHNNIVKYVLIDCGSFRNGKGSQDRMRQIVSDIKDKQLKGAKLDVVVATHQHNDHVSGFVHAEDLFTAIGIEQVWLSWLDNPKNKQAVNIGANHLELRKSLKQASEKLDELSKNKSGHRSHSAMARKAFNTKNLLDDLLGFYGAAPALPAKGIEILKGIGEKKVDYLSPGEIKAIPGIDSGDLRIYVLGPPKNEALLYRKDPKKGESYDHKLSAMNNMIQHFMAAMENRNNKEDKEEQQFPFNKDYKRFTDKTKSGSAPLNQVIDLYERKENGWRTIDEDWMEQASRLALYMDTFTNNSSLVLAFEIVRTGKVLLFAADAQTGNWISWNDLEFKGEETTVENLLSRTVLYKVGHHGSHNSTLKSALEKMTSDDLVAMIPVDKKDPNITKVNGWQMPATNLYNRLKEKTNYRILRMDDGFADECNPKTSKKAKASWAKVSQPKITPLFVEYTIS